MATGYKIARIKQAQEPIFLNVPDLISRWSLQSPELVLAKANDHLPFWMSLVLVIMIGYYLARIAWLLFPAAETAAWTPPPAPARTQNMTENTTTPSQQDIVNAHLFGEADPAEVPAELVPLDENTEDAPDTRLNLKLRATVSAADQEFAHAIVADSSGEEKVYFIRDSIPGGATLHRVDPDKIILNRGGVLEALRLPKEFDGAAQASSPRNTARRTTARQATAQSAVQNLIANNASTLTDIVRPQPFMPNGQMKGYRVFPGRQRSEFLKLGLRPGDLVTEINGVPLTNPAQGMEIFQSLSESSQVSLKIQRNGKDMDIALDTGKLAELSTTQ